MKFQIYCPDPDDPKEVMEAVVLLRRVIEACPTVAVELAPDHYEEFYVLPDGTHVLVDDAGPADELESWLEAVWAKGLEIDDAKRG